MLIKSNASWNQRKQFTTVIYTFTAHSLERQKCEENFWVTTSIHYLVLSSHLMERYPRVNSSHLSFGHCLLFFLKNIQNMHTISWHYITRFIKKQIFHKGKPRFFKECDWTGLQKNTAYKKSLNNSTPGKRKNFKRTEMGTKISFKTHSITAIKVPLLSQQQQIVLVTSKYHLAKVDHVEIFSYPF